MAVTAPGAESAPLLPRASVAPVARSESRRRLPVGIVGLVLVVGGAVLQLIALLKVPWLDGATESHPASVRLGFSWFTERTQRGFAHVYFAWGAWLLFALVLAFGIAACIRWRGGRVFRILGALLGVIGAFATIGGVLVFAYQTKDEVFHIAGNYSEGVYLAMLGLLASAFGAAAGEVGT